MSTFDLYTLHDDGQYPADRNIMHHAETSWPRILEDMAGGFEDFPEIVELWLQSGQGVGDEVRLWRRK